MQCPKCGSPVTPGHTFCPKCGQTFQWSQQPPAAIPVPSRESSGFPDIPRIVWIAIALAIVIVAVGWAFSDIWLSKEIGRAVNAPINSASSPPLDSTSDKVTFENFQQITIGMPYSDVCLLLGGAGDLTRQFNSQRDYEWRSPTGASVVVTFQDERVVTKGSSGL